MTSNHHAPYVLGYTRATMVVTERSQFGLQAATRLHEVGVASNRESERRGECVPGSCTHRPSHHGSWGRPKLAKKLPKAKPMTGVKS